MINKGFQIKKTIHKKGLFGKTIKTSRVEPKIYQSREEAQKIVATRNFIQMPFNMRKDRDYTSYSVVPVKKI